MTSLTALLILTVLFLSSGCTVWWQPPPGQAPGFHWHEPMTSVGENLQFVGLWVFGNWAYPSIDEMWGVQDFPYSTE